MMCRDQRKSTEQSCDSIPKLGEKQPASFLDMHVFTTSMPKLGEKQPASFLDMHVLLLPYLPLIKGLVCTHTERVASSRNF